MTINLVQLQKQIVDFAEKRGQLKDFKLNRDIAHLHLVEELGEVTSELVNKQMRPELFDEKNLKEEVVDVILQSLVLAHCCKVDLEKGIFSKIDELYKRHGIPKTSILKR